MSPWFPFGLLVALPAAGLLGAVPTGYALGALTQGVDVRAGGSGNIGATNVNRLLGWRLGLLTLGLDALKGAIPAGLGLLLWPTLPAAPMLGVAALLGHVTADGEQQRDREGEHDEQHEVPRGWLEVVEHGGSSWGVRERPTPAGSGRGGGVRRAGWWCPRRGAA